MCRWFNCTEKTLHEWLKFPEKHLTTLHIVIIAGKIGRTPAYVFDLILGTKPTQRNQWHNSSDTSGEGLTIAQMQSKGKLFPNDEGYVKATRKPYPNPSSLNEP